MIERILDNACSLSRKKMEVSHPTIKSYLDVLPTSDNMEPIGLTEFLQMIDESK